MSSKFMGFCQNATRYMISSKFMGFYLNVILVIYFSAQNSMPNIKALAHILFEIPSSQCNVLNFKKGHTSTITHPPEKKKILIR